MFRFMSLLIALGLISFCNQPTEPTYASDEEKILGDWNWLSSSGGITGRVTETPETRGYHQTYIFAADDTLSIFRADTLIWRTFYMLGIGSTIFGDSVSVIVIYNKSDPPTWRYVFEGNDTLVLVDNAYDGFGHGFKRK